MRESQGRLAVAARFHALLSAMGNALDGRILAVNLPETAVDFGTSGALHPEGFTHEGARTAWSWQQIDANQCDALLASSGHAAPPGSRPSPSPRRSWVDDPGRRVEELRSE